MTPALTAIVACPFCRGDLTLGATELLCDPCARRFPVVNGVPVLVDDDAPVAVVPATHQSNSLGAEFEAILASGRELVLHIGAGATAKKYPNCIELERKIFRHTDVVADAHAIPLRSQTCDRVMAFNVFEHLRYPARAADEIFRVLKPGGSVMIHTAFLQALHEEPFHFYNATQYGVREWFGRFEIERCQVSANFSPAYMLAFLSAQLLEAARLGSKASEELSALSKTSLAEWAAFWGGAKPPPGFELLQTLPQEFQQRVAAGFELIARKPFV
jgi:uncharacterized protein YbaR (Trm112 family)/predicted SAM-dependent methyltransferase